MNVCVIAAMQKERELLLDAGLENVVLSGIGKVNAAMAATRLILERRPDAIINSGVAGSVREEVGVGDIVVASQTAYHDVWCGSDVPMGCIQGEPRRFDADPELLSAAKAVGGDNVHFGLISSGDQFYWDEAEDRRIVKLYPDVLACDMESAAIAQVCRHFGVPFLSIRIISDVHTDASTQKKSYEDFWTQAPRSSSDFILKLCSFAKLL